MNAEAIAARLRGRAVGNGQYQAHCPLETHGQGRGDRNRSLSLRDGPDGLLLVKCHAGCETRDVLGWMQRQGWPINITTKKVNNGSGPGSSAQPIIRATYDYTDESGNLLFQVVRFEPKGFRQRQPDGKGGWNWNLTGVRRVLYRLPEVIEAVASERTIFIVEGEKDADAAWKIGLPATCNSGGAGIGKWRQEYSATLRNADAVVVPDHDDAGYAHMKATADSLVGVARRVRIFSLAKHWPDCPKGGDLSDWLAVGGTREQLDTLIEQTPEWFAPVSRNDMNKATGLMARCAADIPPEKISWLWPGRLARGKHTTIGGDPGTGKSQILIRIAAAITTGGSWPCAEGTAPPGYVVLLSAEDGAADTVVPRLMAAGADLNRVVLVDGVREESGQRAFDLQRDLGLLEGEITKLKTEGKDVLLVGIDPVTAYMGGGINGDRNTDVRRVLSPITDLAERAKVAVATITHFNKQATSPKALHRFIGSIAFTAAPRIAFVATDDPGDPNRRLLLHAKNNLAKPPQGLAYRPEQRLVGENEDILASWVEWETEPVSTTADQALGTGGGKDEPTATGDAIDFLNIKLAAGRRALVTDLETEARAEGLLRESQRISQSKPFRAARESIGVKINREGFGPGSKCYWSTPDCP
jgi:hypothetical protein